MNTLDTNKTIIFCTDNNINEELLEAVIKHLKMVAAHLPIISVSHKPINLGTNICIGEQKRSWLCLYKQLYLGLREANTKYIGIAEHDCFYSPEHINWIPPKDDIFYYNENNWLIQWAEQNHPELKGMYSRYKNKRLALSQLICNRDLYIDVLTKRLSVIADNAWLIKEVNFIGEPGVTEMRQNTRAKKWA